MNFSTWVALVSSLMKKGCRLGNRVKKVASVMCLVWLWRLWKSRAARTENNMVEAFLRDHSRSENPFIDISKALPMKGTTNSASLLSLKRVCRMLSAWIRPVTRVWCSDRFKRRSIEDRKYGLPFLPDSVTSIAWNWKPVQCTLDSTEYTDIYLFYFSRRLQYNSYNFLTI